ncbi:MAG: Rne/Rng family ribonuclease [Neisseriaceae bacterium]|nr:Rne/Rng family ribonuclease [Neisseriaceae bacterium]
MLQQGIVLPAPTERPAETLLVNVFPQETRVAVLEDEQVCEIHIERQEGRGLVGNVYLGTVKRVLPGMQSAFIDIGLERSAFLHIVDTVEHRRNPNHTRRIEQMMFEGQVLPVQVVKDPIGNKGARVSTQLSLAGRFLVHLPQDDHIGVSQRIEDENERMRLRYLLKEMTANEEACGGFIIRTGADGVGEEELRADFQYLSSVRRNIEVGTRTQAAPILLHQDLPLHLRVLRDIFNKQTRQVWVDDENAYNEMCQFAGQYAQNANNKISLFQKKEKTLFGTYGIDDEIRRALYPRVNLTVGGYLVIEPTEAMTTVDVNTGGFIGRHNFDETVLKTNLEACHALARELRLRNIGGMIIVDFIDMVNPSHRELVLQELANALSYDRTRVTLNGFTSLGLVEITRKRTRESLYHLLSQDCPYCHGRGHIKTMRTVCYEILREIRRASEQDHIQQLRVYAAPSVVEMLIDEEAAALKQLLDSITVEVSLSAESSYTQEQFDIVAS